MGVTSLECTSTTALEFQNSHAFNVMVPLKAHKARHSAHFPVNSHREIVFTHECVTHRSSLQRLKKLSYDDYKDEVH